MHRPPLVDRSGNSVQLGAELHRGGEGIIHEVIGRPSAVAKVFLHPPSADKASKVTWMTSNPPQELLKLAAWPLTTLHEPRSGPLKGFIMPRIDGFKEVHVLYGVQSRRQHFPKADWAFLLTVAANCATAFELLHAEKHLIGDVNEANLLVSPKDATVRLIDCDSFQLTAGSRTFRCDVGSPLFTPPELQGQNFKYITRDESHDHFGLAILLFHLLFQGRHPFSGKYLGSGEMTPERAIGEYRFAFGRNAKALQMAPPPFALPLNFLPSAVGDLFERAFAPPAHQRGRPPAMEWKQHLLALLKQLRTCPQESIHRYPNHLSHCPWCKVTAEGGPAFFIGFTADGPVAFVARADDLAPYWVELSRLPIPNLPAKPAAPQPPPASPLTADATKEVNRLTFVRSFCAMVGAMAAAALLVGFNGAPHLGFVLASPALVILALGGAIWWWLRRNPTMAAVMKERYTARAKAQTALAQAQHEWSRLPSSISVIQGHHAQLETLRRNYLALQPQFDAENARMQKDRVESQRREFLRNVFIRNHGIRNIGDGRKAVLRSYNIETALDVLTRPIHGMVPGFGPSLTQALKEWARSVESQFRFDAKKGVSEQERRALATKFVQRQSQIRGAITRALTALQNRTHETTLQVNSALKELTHCLAAAAQADADLAAVEVSQSQRRLQAFWGGQAYWASLAGIVLLSIIFTEDSSLNEAGSSYSTPQPVSTVPVPSTPQPEASIEAAHQSIPRHCTLRVAPAVSSASLGTVEANTSVAVAFRRNGWRQVTLPGGQQGWTGPRCWTPLAGLGATCLNDDDCASARCSPPPEGATVGQCF